MLNNNKKNNFCISYEDEKIWKEAINNFHKNDYFNKKNINSYNKKTYNLRIIHEEFNKFNSKRKKSKIYFESLIDLHGLKQKEAYFLLLNFLKISYERKFNIVLVITGKGRLHKGGILQKFVPLWLETKKFLSYVNDFHHAKYYHGGEGALYVKLKKNNYHI